MQGKDESKRANKSETRHVVSSGGVIFRIVDGDFETALILTGGVWCLPKGLVEEGEAFEHAAVREVKEETGLSGELVREIGEISYSFFRDTQYCKTVHFYLLKHIGGSIENHDSEADDVKWFPIPKALQIMAHPNERRILAKAMTMLKRYARGRSD